LVVAQTKKRARQPTMGSSAAGLSYGTRWGCVTDPIKLP